LDQSLVGRFSRKPNCEIDNLIDLPGLLESCDVTQHARPVGDSWRVDETYLKIRGQWVYLYRAVDKAGRTVDFLLGRRRDMAAATRFFSRATKQYGAPWVITLDGYAASHRAVAKLKTAGILPRRVQVRSCKYLNNVIEQDHRRIQQRGAAIIQARGLSSAKSAAQGVVDTVRSIIEPTPAEEWHSIALCADGSYGIEKGLISSFPTRSDGKKLEIVQDLVLNEFSKAKIESSVDELKEERAMVSHLIAS
jgi:transposase-like protein